MIKIKNSPVSQIDFFGFDLLIKRDDLLHPDFTGNKARKFAYFLEKDLDDVDKIVSFGSNQSNAMYSLSVLCKLKNKKYEYYTHHISSFLKDNPIGNYKHALNNAMDIKLYDDCPYSFLKKNRNLFSKTKKIGKTLFIPEGGRCETSRYGINQLALEIINYKKIKNIKDLLIFLPSGTGTTALFLQKSLLTNNDDSKVLTISCVGSKDYLKKEFYSLEADNTYHPKILEIKHNYFGKLDCQLYKFWIKLQKETDIEFDLLYDPIGLKSLFEFLKNKKINPKEKLMYIHQGGIKGNESMIQRYKRKCYENF